MFSDNLKKIRKSRGLTQEQVAGAIGLKRSTYAYYELGKTSPDIATLTKLVRFFDVTYDQLFDMPVHNTVTFKSPDEYPNTLMLRASKDEKLLISLFRLLPGEDKKDIIKILNEKLEKIYFDAEDSHSQGGSNNYEK